MSKQMNKARTQAIAAKSHLKEGSKRSDAVIEKTQYKKVSGTKRARERGFVLSESIGDNNE
jgi:hypothetical protein